MGLLHNGDTSFVFQALIFCVPFAHLTNGLWVSMPEIQRNPLKYKGFMLFFGKTLGSFSSCFAALSKKTTIVPHSACHTLPANEPSLIARKACR